MRVLHVSRYFHPHVGGTENVIAGLAEALAPMGIESTVVVARRRRDGPGPAPRIPVLEVPVMGPDRFPVPRGCFGQLVRAVRDTDVVHLHDVRFLFETMQVLAHTFDRPLILSTHGLMFHTEVLSGTKRRLWRTYYARALDHFDLVAAASERDATLCREVGIERNLRVIHNGVSVAGFAQDRGPARRQPGRLLSFGRISPEKGLDRLIPVMEAAPDHWRLRIAGAGQQRHTDQLRSRASDLGDRVQLLGYLADEVLADELASCACVLLPSRQEAFGLTLVEAMASGAPIVASDIPAYRELAGGAGIALADFDDPDAVVRAVEEATSSHDADRSRSKAIGFSLTASASTYARCYEDVARHAPAARAGWHRVLGVDVEALEQPDILRAVQEALSGDGVALGGAAIIANHNLHSAALHRRDPCVRRFYEMAHHVFIDGMPLAWFGRLTGQHLSRRHRTTWIDLIDPLADLVVAHGWRMMFVAGTDEAGTRGGDVLRSRHPGLALTVRSGHFDETHGGAENSAVLAEVAAAAPHVLLVGMGMPRQEHWIAANHHQIAAGVVMNLGGLLDYLAGIKPTPARWVSRLGFEWLSRLASEPRRLAHRYLVEPWMLLPVAGRELAGAVASLVPRRLLSASRPSPRQHLTDAPDHPHEVGREVEADGRPEESLPPASS